MLSQLIKNMLQGLNLEYKYGRVMRKKNGVEYNKKVAGKAEGNAIISEALQNKDSVLVARIGSSELLIILNYLHFKNRPSIKWNDNLKNEIWQQSGIFPSTDTSLNNFAKAYLDAIRQTDIMGVWYNEGEDVVMKRYCNKATLVPLESIEPYFFEDPWSNQLKDKNVLVIHPFENSINHQYSHNRQHLFLNNKVLPPFKLQTLRAVQAQVFNKTSYKSWEEIYNYMKDEISKRNFDIAIIGAGGYGLLLGAFIKSLGKKAIHMGGATQILFGIKGKRWEERDEFSFFFNDYWKYPDDAERPEGAALLEGGAYW